MSSTRTLRPRPSRESESASSLLPCEPRCIETQDELAEVCASLSPPWLAIDTEFIGEKYYFPRLELVQLAVPGAIYLIDTQKVPDLRALRPLLTDPAIEKIVHSGSQDIDLMRKATGEVPAPVFDTQLAASFLGYGLQISLSNLASSLAGVKMDGKHTTSDWSARPLSREQLEYAARDVAWLGLMRDRLRAELEKKGRLHWFLEEQAARTRESSECIELGDEESYRRVKNGKTLAPREQVFLRLLAQWREETARRLDNPRRQVFPDEGLIELAVHQPTTKEELGALRRVPKGCAMRFADVLIPVLARAAAVPRDQWPRHEGGARPAPPPPGVVELAQAILRTEAERHGVASSLLANTGDLTSLVCAPAAERASLEIPLLTGWRFDVAGQRVLALLDGRLLIRVGAEGLEIAEGSA